MANLSPMEQLREVLHNVVMSHEEKGCKESTPEEECWTFRRNAIAFLAHSIGIGGGQLEQVLPYLEKYEEQHQKIHDKECPEQRHE